MTEALDAWFLRSGCRADPRLRLFCFPFAAGTAAIFQGWAKHLPPEVELLALQLPGRERRFHEPPIRSMGEAVRRVVDVLSPLTDVPFTFFGYSMGGLLAYEVAQTLRRRGAPLPRRLLIAAVSAPHLDHARQPPVHLQPYEALIDEIRRFQGTPETVLQNRELMELVMPMIRADFEMLETYRAANDPPLPIPLSLFGGADDREVPLDKLMPWRDYTAAAFSMKLLPGGHFFLKTATDQLLSQVSDELKTDLSQAAV